MLIRSRCEIVGSMDDVDVERRRLYRELQKAEVDLVRRMYAWHFSVGPFHIDRVVTPQHTARIYVAFNIACFVAGLVLAPMGGALDTIGVSLIVGALFSFGTFVSQFWAIQTQLEVDVAKDVLGKEVEFDELVEKRADLRRRLKEFNQEHPG
jgi:hypothetical protein